MTRRFVSHHRFTTRTMRMRATADTEFTGACTCRAFSGGRAVHNYGQPGCRYARTDSGTER